jgi:hypothetical protein
MPILLFFLNYMVTLFVVLGVASGGVPAWGLALIPIAIALQYRVYRGTESSEHEPLPVRAA